MFGKRSVLIFIEVQSTDELRKRLLGRKTDSLEEIERRVAEAKNEMKQAGKFDYRVLNDKMDKAYKEMVSIFKKEGAVKN